MRTVLTVCLILISLASVRSDSGMKLDVGSVSDSRFGLMRHLNLEYDVSYIASRYKSPNDWKRRAAELREQVLGAAGLLPTPAKCPLNPRVFGRIDHGDYTVEKCYFESYPGFYCTGNLYRPKGKGPFPGVLNTHGHWAPGRLVHNESTSVPGRAANFAKQGYVVFSYDMVGYNDSKQVRIPYKETGEPEKHDALGDRRNRLWGISLGGLQTWNSVRAIDFLQSLPDVDSNRIAITGASGGGTQTFLLTAADERVAAAAPVVMVSHTMQGGCRCENPPNLRIDTDNVEIASVAAPRPLFLVAATGDWTRETPEVEFPAIQSVYRLFGAEEKTSCVRFDVGHNYNRDSREAVYSFFGRWLPGKPLPQPVKEQAVEIGKNEDLLCFPDGKLPDGALKPDAIVEQLMRDSEAQLEANRPKDPASLDRFRKLYEPALRRALSVPSSFRAEAEVRGVEGEITKLVLRDRLRGAEIPALLFDPSQALEEVKEKFLHDLAKTTGRRSPAEPSGAALVVHEKGTRAARGSTVVDLVMRGWRVLAIDAFNAGEHVAPNDAPARDYDKDFFDTYNRTDTAERVYDILLALSWLQSGQSQITDHRSRIALVGHGKAGLWCLLARPFSTKVDRLVVDAAGVDTSSDDALLSEFYVPCLRRAGDFRTAVALAAPGDLCIHNTQGRFDTSWAESAYTAAKRPGALKTMDTLAADTEIARWLCSED